MRLFPFLTIISCVNRAADLHGTFPRKEHAMEHWESISPGGYRFVYDEAVFPPGTGFLWTDTCFFPSSFKRKLSSFPSRGDMVPWTTHR